MARLLQTSGDARFPHLQLVMDSKAMGDLFERSLPDFKQGRRRLERVRVSRLSGDRDVRCKIGYELLVTDLRTGRRGVEHVLGVIEPLRDRPDDDQQHMWPPTPGAAPTTILAELDMRLWRFPDDPEMHGLRALSDPDTLEDLIIDHWADLGLGFGDELCSLQSTLVKFVPAGRCTMRHEIRLTDHPTLVLYSKCHGRKTNTAGVFRTMQAVARTDACQSGAFSIAQPYFYDPGVSAFFIGSVEGVNADDRLSEPGVDAMFEAAAVALAGVQQCEAEDLPAHRDAIYRVSEAERVLGAYDSRYNGVVRALQEALVERRPRLTSLAPVATHGAYRLSQLLVQRDGRLAIIDFDDVARGDPIGDVGSFIAHLMYLPLKDKVLPGRSSSAIRRFCRAYAASAPWGLPEDLLRWHTAVELIAKQAKKCVSRPKKNLREKVDALLETADDVLAGRLSLF